MGEVDIGMDDVEDDEWYKVMIDDGKMWYGLLGNVVGKLGVLGVVVFWVVDVWGWLEICR